MFNPYVMLAAGIAFIIAICGSFYAGYSWENDRWIAAVAQQKQDAADLLQEATNRVDALNQANAAKELQQQKDATDHAAEITAKEGQISDLAKQLDAANSLRIARRGPNGVNAVPAAANAGPGTSKEAAANSGSVAGPFSELDAIIKDALASAAYADSCYADAASRAKPNPTATQQ